MILDDTLSRILLTIKEEVKVKYQKDLTIEQINNIVDTQIEATKEGLMRGITVHWARFCKFVFTDKGTLKNNVIKFNSLLDNRDDILPHEKGILRKNYIIEQSLNKVDKIKKATYTASKSFSVDEVLDIKEDVKPVTIMFKAINRKHKKDE